MCFVFDRLTPLNVGVNEDDDWATEDEACDEEEAVEVGDCFLYLHFLVRNTGQFSLKMKRTEPCSQGASAHRKINSSISTRPPHPGQNRNVMPVSFMFEGIMLSSSSSSATQCAVRPRMAMHKQPMSAFKTCIEIVVFGMLKVRYQGYV
jgi:hypothetical protein